MSEQTVLTATDLTRYYPVARGAFQKPAMLKALDGISFTLQKRKTLAVVGESGCGKSTLARLVTMIERPTAGSLLMGEHDIAAASTIAPGSAGDSVELAERGRRAQGASETPAWPTRRLRCSDRAWRILRQVGIKRIFQTGHQGVTSRRGARHARLS